MARDVQDLGTAIRVLDDGLDNQPNFRKLTVLGADVARKPRRARVNSDPGNEPSINGTRFEWKANLSIGAGDFSLFPVHDREELLESRIRPDRIAFGAILEVCRSYVAN